jgi:hypothetical protein
MTHGGIADAKVRHMYVMSRDDPHFRLRVPPDLHDRIAASAKKNSRSINAEIVNRLELSYAYAMELRKASDIWDDHGLQTLAGWIAEKITQAVPAQSDREAIAGKFARIEKLDRDAIAELTKISDAARSDSPTKST